ncbi:hypothetical protein NBRC110019_29540 [Neptunitalea chrysea]|uniref:DUF2480 family protein n=1 Tax=Neptunitalea chrysea TaxID=1647581 RepID=A0A9W6B798_9FLAO|nr:DUF2480 family protein [Neptunitalea chrysea]GLB53913.1 hypothetical protein NBRC110019_29540 [Neptunitalea chrysea]
MADEIVNRVANSKLVTVDLEDYYPKGERMALDIKDWLLEEFILREKDFREHAKNHDWEQYKGTYVALTCSTDAIVPAWAFMLLSTYAVPHAKKVIIGTLEELETIIYKDIIAQTDFSFVEGAPVIVKGCANKPVPANAYIFLIEKILPIAKSLMYGEACSAVPLFKNKN